MKNHGPCVYFDTSSRGGSKNRRHNCYRADVTVDGIRYRRRGYNREALEKWVASFCQKKGRK